MSLNIVIYDQNDTQVAWDNTPPQRRLSKFIAWFACLLSPLQFDHDLLFKNGWTDGSNAPNVNSPVAYSYGSRVIDLNGAVYECYNTAGATVSGALSALNTTLPQNNPANWFKVLDTFIGIRERAHYTGQKVYVEFLLNRFFQVGAVGLPFTGASHINQIYIGVAPVSTSLWLTNGLPLAPTSYLSNLGGNARQFLGNSYVAFTPFKFTINCPAATATAIGNNQPPGTGGSFWNGQSTIGFTTAQVAAGNAIMALAAKYVQVNFPFDFAIY